MNRVQRKVSIQVTLLLLFVVGVGADPASAQSSGETLTLNEAVARTLEGSREVRDARLALDGARQGMTEARGRLLPRVDLTMRYARNLTPPATFLPTILFDPTASPDDVTRVQFGLDNVWTGALMVEQPLWEGRALAGVRGAARLADLRAEELRAREQEVVTATRLRYYDLLLAREREVLLRESLERVETSLRQTRALEAEGLASEYEVLRLEVELANLEPLLDRATNEQRAARRALLVAMGTEPESEEIVPSGSLSSLILDDPEANAPEDRVLLELMGSDPTAGADELLATAREDQATLRQLRLEERLRRTELRAEQSDRLPRVSLFGSYDVQAQQDGSPSFFAGSGERGYGRMVGVQVSVPLFTGFQRRARAEQARIELRRTEVRLDLVEDDTEAQLRSLVEAVAEARSRARGQSRAVEQAERGYRIISGQFSEGLASRLEVTDAEVALRQSATNYAEAVHAYLSARARLDALVGRVPGV
ncbi:MAG: TolC family protein [Gemmatimonadales bacterium]|nr:MAG: TolC family protein [Gemmatimonadales bacterium]